MIADEHSYFNTYEGQSVLEFGKTVLLVFVSVVGHRRFSPVDNMRLQFLGSVIFRQNVHLLSEEPSHLIYLKFS
jgi:hypothetical protein